MKSSFKYAEQLKRSATDAERFLYQKLKSWKAPFQFQQPVFDNQSEFIGIVDFLFPNKLVIEVDGGYHSSSEYWIQKDQNRDSRLEENGYRVKHIDNDVLQALLNSDIELFCECEFSDHIGYSDSLIEYWESNKPKQKKKSKNYYFDEVKILKYLKGESDYKEIRPTMLYMAKGIAGKFGMKLSNEELENILWEKLQRAKDGWDNKKGTLFTYLTVSFYREMIKIQSEEIKRKKNFISIEQVAEKLSEKQWEEQTRQTDREYWLIEFVNHIKHQLDTYNPKKRVIAECIIELFESKEVIEKFNKKALYVLIREMSGFPTRIVTEHVKRLEMEYKFFVNTKEKEEEQEVYM